VIDSIHPPLHFGQRALWILSQYESNCNLIVTPLTLLDTMTAATIQFKKMGGGRRRAEQT